jgi:hypothetical protein
MLFFNRSFLFGIFVLFALAACLNLNTAFAAVIEGTSASEDLYGTEDDDIISGREGDDVLYGLGGNDVLDGEEGASDLWGGAGADTFVIREFGALSGLATIKDFDPAMGDAIDLSDFLSETYDPSREGEYGRSLEDFLQFFDDGTNTYITIDSDGGGNNYQFISIVENTSGLPDLLTLVADGTLIVGSSNIQTFNFDDNQVPPGWTLIPSTSPWGQASIQNGRMEAWPTDNRLHLMFPLSTPANSIAVRFRGELRNTFWGSINAVSFVAANAQSAGLLHLNEEYDSSDGVNENFFRIAASGGLIESTLYPETFPTFEYELTLVGSVLTGTVTNTATGQHYELSLPNIPFSAEQVTGINLVVAHTTNSGPTWIDDVEIEIDGIVVNEAPTAVAGDDQAVRAGDTVFLDGSASFDDNTASSTLQYAWSFSSTPSGSTATLLNDDTATPSFFIDLPGTYVADLVVTDEEGLSSEVDQVLVSSSNLAPTADAGDDQLVIVGTTATLDGSGSSDPELDALSFAWSLGQTPAGSLAALAGAASATPTLVPDLEGVYEVVLTVSDAIGPGLPDSVYVTATTAEAYAEMMIVDASTLVSGLPPSSVTTQGNQNALTNFLAQAVVGLQSGDLAEAIDKLQKLIARTDGCALNGTPDGNGPGRDWITSCADQAPVYDALTSALAALQP